MDHPLLIPNHHLQMLRGSKKSLFIRQVNQIYVMVRSAITTREAKEKNPEIVQV